ncbi:MAG TPA: PEP-CTERM sorting domain-containing protein [Pyrinomonadaceae bacterium]|nr:PEP-CTERM sorting domain-containing protein [Pyrinomonadaceae bacterium]
MPQYKLRKFAIALAIFAIASLGSAMTAKADGVLHNTGPNDQSGTGFGTVINILTLQVGKDQESETGSVTPDGITGDAKQTSACVTVQELLDAGINQDNIAFVFNLNQQGTPDDMTLHLDSWRVNFYDSAGNVLFFADIDAESVDDYTVIEQGTGQSGYLFTISGVTATEWANFFADPDNCIGAEALISGGVNDGPENFYVTTTVPQAVPEPASMLLLGTGLLGIAGAARRRYGKK